MRIYSFCFFFLFFQFCLVLYFFFIFTTLLVFLKRFFSSYCSKQFSLKLISILKTQNLIVSNWVFIFSVSYSYYFNSIWIHLFASYLQHFESWRERERETRSPLSLLFVQPETHRSNVNHLNWNFNWLLNFETGRHSRKPNQPFSPKVAKQKWHRLEHNLSQMALNRLTVSQLEKDLERFVSISIASLPLTTSTKRLKSLDFIRLVQYQELPIIANRSKIYSTLPFQNEHSKMKIVFYFHSKSLKMK